MEKQQRGRVHKTFDFAKADDTFKRVTSEEACGVTSAISLVAVERIRDALGLRVGKAVPVDAFVFGKGRAKDPRVTRVSGCPYWPVSRPWPTEKSGTPMKFLAQVCFADSKDLFPKLPGDLLLIFVGGVTEALDDWFWGTRITRLEWVKFSEAPVISKLPKGVTPVAKSEWYGVRHRTFDYPAAFTKVRAIRKRDKEDDDLFSVPCIEGTKIGGASKGRLLCRLESIWPSEDVAFPWTNQRSKRNGRDGLTLGDAGSISIMMSRRGQLRVVFDSA